MMQAIVEWMRMWFDDEDLTGRRIRKSKPRGRRLNVKAGGRARPGQPWSPMAQGVMLLFMALAVIGLCGFLVIQSYRALFTRNPMFTLRHLDVSTQNGAFVSRALIYEWIDEHEQHRVWEGMNLFEVNIGALRQDLLQKTPNFQSVSIERVLPDILKVAVTERSPVAYLRQRRGDHVFLDDVGMAFVERRSRRDTVPQIIEYKGINIRPGQQGEGLLRDAVWAIAEFRRVFASDDLRLLRVSVRGDFGGRPDSLRLALSNGASVDLWWKRTANSAFDPDPDLVERLAHLANLVRQADEEGLHLRSVNLTLDDYRANSPFTTR